MNTKQALLAFGRRHRRTGILFGTLVLLLLQRALPMPSDGLRLAIEPFTVAAIAAGAGALIKGLSGRKKDPRYYKPDENRIRRYEGYQAEDIDRLRGPRPFSGPGVGFTPQEMGAQYGQDASQSRAMYLGEVANLNQAASQGTLRRSSGSYHRGLQRALGHSLGRESEIRRRNILANALQARRDLYSRLGATSSAYGQGVNIFNKRRAGKAGAQSTLNVTGQAVGEGLMGFGGAYRVPV